jgi:hypothetical protein
MWASGLFLYKLVLKIQSELSSAPLKESCLASIAVRSIFVCPARLPVTGQTNVPEDRKVCLLGKKIEIAGRAARIGLPFFVEVANEGSL